MVDHPVLDRLNKILREMEDISIKSNLLFVINDRDTTDVQPTCVHPWTIMLS